MFILNNSKNVNYKYIYFFVFKVLFQNRIVKIILVYSVTEMRNVEVIKEDCEFIEYISIKECGVNIF